MNRIMRKNTITTNKKPIRVDEVKKVLSYIKGKKMTSSEIKKISESLNRLKEDDQMTIPFNVGELIDTYRGFETEVDEQVRRLEKSIRGQDKTLLGYLSQMDIILERMSSYFIDRYNSYM